MENEITFGNDELRSILLEALDDNREIEFQLNGTMYFAAPQTAPPLSHCYGILDVENKKWVFKGSIPELLSFPFPDGLTFVNNIEAFNFLYIL